MTDLDPAADAAVEELEPIVDEAGEGGADSITAPDPAPAPAPAVTDSPKPEPFWTRDELRKSQKANKRLQADFDKAQQELEDLRAQRRQQPAAEQDEDDPQRAYIRHAEQIALNTRLDTSELLARDKHGDEAVDEMLEWLGTRPDMAQWAMKQKNAYASAMQAYKKERLAAEIGDDPEAWRAAERARLQEQIRAELAAEQQQPNALATAGHPTPARIPTPGATQTSARPKAGQFSGPKPLSAIGKNDFT